MAVLRGFSSYGSGLFLGAGCQISVKLMEVL